MLGSFVTLDEYFGQVEDPGFGEEFTSDQYQTPFLSQSLIRKKSDSISQVIDYWNREYRFRNARAFEFLNRAVSRKSNQDAPSMIGEVDRNELDRSVESPPSEALATSIDQAEKDAAEQLASRVNNGKDSSKLGLVVLNPNSFTRRQKIEVGNNLDLDTSVEPVFAACQSSRELVVDVPAMGFVSIPPGNFVSKVRAKRQVPLVEDLTLRNEFLELTLDEASGALRSIHLYGQRGNVFSQQLAIRQRAARQSRGGASTVYSIMKADSVKVIENGSVSAAIQARGKIMSGDNDGEVLAEFQQTFRLIRGKRVIECDVELSPQKAPRNDPWNSYYCLRFAWPNESATLYRSVNDTRNPVSENKFEAPQFIEIDDASSRITLLTNGLPYHRRVGYRKLDSLLIVSGESRQRFRYGIGVGIENPNQQAADFATSCATVECPAGDSKSAFLFHFDQRSVMATDWEAISNDQGECIGARIRILECKGRSGTLQITAPYDVIRCHRTNFNRQVETDGKVDKGKGVFDFGANDYFQVELFWKA